MQVLAITERSARHDLAPMIAETLRARGTAAREVLLTLRERFGYDSKALAPGSGAGPRSSAGLRPSSAAVRGPARSHARRRGQT